jgi:hypothetical protein
VDVSELRVGQSNEPQAISSGRSDCGQDGGEIVASEDLKNEQANQYPFVMADLDHFFNLNVHRL